MTSKDKEKGSKESVKDLKVDSKTSEKEIVKEEAKPIVAPKVTPKAPAMLGIQQSTVDPIVPFRTWFRLRSKERGYKPHWIEGMKAYTKTSTPRSLAEWDNVFSQY